MGIVSTTKPMPTRHNGLFTTNRGELEYPSLWDGLELAYFPHNDGGGKTMKGYGNLATNADLLLPSWIDTEIGRMVSFNGSEAGHSYANTNNIAFLNKIDNDFSYMMWTLSIGNLTNSERWWSTEDSDGPKLFAYVKSASGTSCAIETKTFPDDESDSEYWKTTSTSVDTGTRPMSFVASIDWSTEGAILSVDGGSKAVTSGTGGTIGNVSESVEPIFIGARNLNGDDKKNISSAFSTIAWWSRQLSQGEHRILGNDPFVLCRRVEV